MSAADHEQAAPVGGPSDLLPFGCGIEMNPPCGITVAHRHEGENHV